MYLVCICWTLKFYFNNIKCDIPKFFTASIREKISKRPSMLSIENAFHSTVLTEKLDAMAVGKYTREKFN